MARVLVTRAADQAEETARRLLERGHVPVIAPLRRVDRLVDKLDGAVPGRIVVTSANALKEIAIPPGWLAASVLAVGEATALAARSAGFTKVAAAGGDARSAASLLLEGGLSPEPVVFLAGSPRKPDFEAMLEAAGQAVRVVEIYRMVENTALPAAVLDEFAAGSLDAVLHFSAESAATFVKALALAGLPLGASATRHVALSEDAARPLIEAGLSRSAFLVAPCPTQEALLDLLGPLQG
ncbi:MAG: uroporphyrinogen-III synthase [Beijerinckiaceae bacterium]|nr:uroporphyrinogen-III synthase [Beijerinckiaceae bacterium]MCZ8300589.1 uroporphyrinogen-III synthase [Beijerinckiaceae bacterium]